MLNSEHISALLRAYSSCKEGNLKNDMRVVIMEAVCEYVNIPFTYERDIYTKLTSKEKELASNGQRIAAIKEVRARTGFGLKEAKDLVDKFYPPV